MNGLCLNWLDYCRDRRGVASVEMALTFPFFFFFVLLIVEVSFFFYTSTTVERGVHNYSRRLVEMTQRGTTARHADAIADEISRFVGARFVKSLVFAAGQVTPTTNFSKTLNRNQLDRSYLRNTQDPLYFRVVVKRQALSHTTLKPLWDAIAESGGMLADLDLLIVVPYPIDGS